MSDRLFVQTILPSFNISTSVKVLELGNICCDVRSKVDTLSNITTADDGRNISSESSCYIYFITCLLSCFNLSNIDHNS